MGRRELVDVTVHLHAETARAILVSDDGDRDGAVWLPLSQIEVDKEKLKPPAVVVTLPEWLAVDKGLV